MKNNNLRNDGQVLLVGLMVIALITTIVGAGALRATTSTRTTKQQEEASKASNVAKGMQEAGINYVTVAPGDFSGINPGVITTANPITTTTSFVTPNTVAKDNQYVFYMADYNSATNTFTSPLNTAADAQLDIYFQDVSGTCPVIEVTEIKNDYSVVKKHHSSTCETNTIVSSSQQIITSAGGAVVGAGGTTTFSKKISYLSSQNTILVIVRPYFASTKIGFVGSTTLKPQGTEITANTRTLDGAQVTEKSYLAYPQIPLALFATAF